MSTRSRSDRSHPRRKTKFAERDASGWVMETVGDLGVTHDIHAKRAMLDAYCQDEDPEPIGDRSCMERRPLT